MEAAGLAFGIGLSAKMVKWSPEHNRMLGIPPDIHEGSHELFISYIHASDPRPSQALQRAKEQRVDFEGSSARQGLTARSAGCQVMGALITTNRRDVLSA